MIKFNGQLRDIAYNKKNVGINKSNIELEMTSDCSIEYFFYN